MSKNNVPVRITDERLKHINNNHPEMVTEINKIVETIKNPDYILKGDFGELLAIKYYTRTPVSEGKYLIVVYKEISKIDGFLITAYFSRKKSKRRKIIWKH